MASCASDLTDFNITVDCNTYPDSNDANICVGEAMAGSSAIGMFVLVNTVNHLNMARTLNSAITILPWIA